MLPLNVQLDILRPFWMPPVPAVTPPVMALTQYSMIAPRSPWRHT